MEPRRTHRGRIDAGWPARQRPSLALQWSRGEHTAEDPWSDLRVEAVGTDLLQWSRGEHTAEDCRPDLRCFARRVEIASMEPRRTHRGRFAIALAAIWVANNVLQWSRGELTAEETQLEALGTCPRRFNGAAANTPRKSVWFVWSGHRWMAELQWSRGEHTAEDRHHRFALRALRFERLQWSRGEHTAEDRRAHNWTEIVSFALQWSRGEHTAEDTRTPGTQ